MAVVGRARIHACASNVDSALSVLHAAEAHLPKLLAELAGFIGSEFLAIRRLRVGMSMWTTGGAIPSEVGRQLRESLFAQVREAQRLGRSAVSTDLAWFPSHTAAIAAYLEALADPSRERWPFTGFESLGTTWVQVLSRLADDGLAVAGDVLAALVGNGAARRFPECLSAAEAFNLANRWTTAAGASFTVPPELAQWRPSIPTSLPAQYHRLTLLAQLFAVWPPARSLAMRDDLLDTLQAVPNPGMRSAAGGLLAWAELMARCGVDRELSHGYPDVRHRGAVLWALGRALQLGTLAPSDPVLVLFAGERPGQPLAPEFTLRECDPETLWTIAIRSLGRPGGIRVSPLGEGVVAIDQRGIIVHWQPDGDVHDAVSTVVERILEVTGFAPPGVEVWKDLRSDDLDLLHRFDVPSLPEPWRRPVLALASALGALLQSTWNAQVDQLRGWQARVADGTVEVARRDVQRVSLGGWLRGERVSFDGRELSVRVA